MNTVKSDGTSSSSEDDGEKFFKTQSPPPWLDEELSKVKDFVDRHAKEGRRVVVVTSGGTTVPLEHNTIRFLDNFSAGTRGAASAEYFARTGLYAVIFMHRQHSLQPFSRHYSHTTNPFLDLIEVNGDDVAEPLTVEELDPHIGKDWKPIFPCPRHFSPKPPPDPAEGMPPARSNSETIRIRSSHLHPMTTLLRSYSLVKSRDLLYYVHFVTVHDYLFLLRGIGKILGETSIGKRAMFYLAAAVSDFFLPQNKMSEHKIQSNRGSLVLEMDTVPKILRPLVQEWSNSAYIISFKLETDPQLLISKARQALQRYGHQIVIANDLRTRKSDVYFVTANGQEHISLTFDSQAMGEEIEQEIISRLVELHGDYIVQQ